jgi:hypothetical protein
MYWFALLIADLQKQCCMSRSRINMIRLRNTEHSRWNNHNINMTSRFIDASESEIGFPRKSFSLLTKSKFRRNFILISTKFRCFDFQKVEIGISIVYFRQNRNSDEIPYWFRRNFDVEIGSSISVLMSKSEFRFQFRFRHWNSDSNFDFKKSQKFYLDCLSKFRPIISLKVEILFDRNSDRNSDEINLVGNPSLKGLILLLLHWNTVCHN